MSFDMTIRSNRACSKSVALKPLSTFLGSLPNVKTVRPALLVFEIRPDRHMEISLETASPEGGSEAPSEASAWRVNCIRLHIPYSFLGKPGSRAENDYYNLAYKITTLLRWKLYDEQKGKYLRIFPCAYSGQEDFDRLVLGPAGASEAGAAVGRRIKSPQSEAKSSSPKQPKSSPGKKKSSPRKRRGK